MSANPTIEIFSAGCPACDEVVALVNRVAKPGASVRVLDMRQPEVAARAKALGVVRVPSVVIDGRLAPCCAGGGVDESALRSALEN
jgi:glutaredoxin